MMPEWLTMRLAGARARGTPSCVGPARTVRAGIATLLLIPQLTGCFHHVPVSSPVPVIGSEVSIGISDRGRVALAESVGSGVRRLSGRVLEGTDTSLVLSITSVEYLEAALPARWTGERVHVSRDFVTDIREKRLSRSRSWIMAGLLVAGAIAVSLIAIAGFGGDPGPERPPIEGEPQ